MQTSLLNLLVISGFVSTVVFAPQICSAWENSYYPHSRYQYFYQHSPYRSYSRQTSFSGYSRYYGYSRPYESLTYSSLSYSSAPYYRDYYYYPVSFTLGTVPTNIKVFVDDGSGLRETSSSSGLKNIAWDALKHGEYDIALDYFIQNAENNPNSGLPKVGYALTAASLGNLAVATKVMRNVFATNPATFKINPNSLGDRHLDKKSLTLINNLINKFSLVKTPATDHAFMLATLYYLKHNYAAASNAITLAQNHGDKSPSAVNLQTLISQQLENHANDLASLIQTKH